MTTAAADRLIDAIAQFGEAYGRDPAYKAVIDSLSGVGGEVSQLVSGRESMVDTPGRRAAAEQAHAVRENAQQRPNPADGGRDRQRAEERGEQPSTFQDAAAAAKERLAAAS